MVFLISNVWDKKTWKDCYPRNNLWEKFRKSTIKPNIKLLKMPLEKKHYLHLRETSSSVEHLLLIVFYLFFPFYSEQWTYHQITVF